MKVSLCMIVKNEIRMIERCLESARPLVDEIIIHDTGSTDGTQDVCRRFADIFEEVPWPGSFSDARNAVIERASGDYIMVLDGDEYVQNPEEFASVKDALEKLDPDALAVRINNELPGNQALQSDFLWQVRLFRNVPAYRYKNAVHNQITDSIMAAPKYKESRIAKCSLMIYHVGYSYSQDELYTKYSGRLDLLYATLETAKASDNKRLEMYYWFQTANCHFMMREYDKVLELMDNIDFKLLTVENAYSTHLMAVHAAAKAGKEGVGMRHAQSMLDLWPQEPMSFFMKGLMLMGEQNWAGSYAFLVAAFQQSQLTEGREIKYALDPAYVAAAVGDVCMQMQRFGEAKWFYSVHLEKFADNERVRLIESQIVRRNGSPAAQDEHPNLLVRPVD